MKISKPLTDRGALFTPLVSAVGLNLAANARVWRRGHRAWKGAVNTDYDPLDRATAAQPFEAFRALHSAGRVDFASKSSPASARARWRVGRR